MEWIKQDGSGYHRWVCSHCGTLLIRVSDEHPLPKKCVACGKEEDPIKGDPPIFRTPKPKWILKSITKPDVVELECTYCGEIVTIMGNMATIPESDAVQVCRKCKSVMGGLVDGEESAGADDAECP